MCVYIYIYIYIYISVTYIFFDYLYIYIYIYNSKSLYVVQSLYFGSKLPLFRFICTFLTKAACCGNIEIVLHTTTLSYI